MWNDYFVFLNLIQYLVVHVNIVSPRQAQTDCNILNLV